MAEDAYQGDAQFMVTMDGKQISGINTVTALHNAGQTETFTFDGSWGQGSHIVGIQFLNDAYNASTGEDRNLFFQSGSYDGHAFGSPTERAANGTMTFRVGSITAPTSAPAPVTTINGTSHHDSLTATAGQTLVNGNDGNDIITLEGNSNAIYGGAGNDTITLLGKGNWVDGGAGDDIIHDDNGNNTIVLNAAYQGTDYIYGNVMTNGDLFDLRQALAGSTWNQDVSTLSNYLHASAIGGGSDTVISITPQGTSGSQAQLAVLHGVGSLSIGSFLGRAIVH